MLPVTVTVTATMTAMATGVKAAYASRSCIATKVRRAMFATIAATPMLLVFLLLLVSTRNTALVTSLISASR